MSKETQIVIDALREIITNPQHEEEKIARYFSLTISSRWMASASTTEDLSGIWRY